MAEGGGRGGSTGGVPGGPPVAGDSPRRGDFPSPEAVIASREGDVLIKSTLLKGDHFPGCQNTKLSPLLDGAPNFRQVAGLPVYGVAIPTVRGLRNVLDELGAANGQRRVLWHNMREEPVLYINGKPFVVREADQPFCNVEYTGIDRSRVEDMEARLKRDVLREAGRYDGHILVTEEDDDMNVLDVWEPVTEADVQTPLEVYAEAVAGGYDVDYTRVPITDEKAPKGVDFEALIRRLWNVPPDAALVFNCQMGRGRTTTGMVIATLVALRRLGAFPTGVSAAWGPQGAMGANSQQWMIAAPGQAGQQQQQQQAEGLRIQQPEAVLTPPQQLKANGNGARHQHHQQRQQQQQQQQGLAPPLTAVPAWFAASKAARFSGSGGGAAGVTSPGGGMSGDAKLKAGMFGVVRSLLRVLERGAMGKAILDAVIDACAAMQNLREAISTYRGRLMAESKESRRATLMGVCLEYLERYYMLLAFTSYLTWPKFDPASPGHVSFQDWMDTRPELRSILSRMLRRNPLSALELHIPAATLPPPSGEPQEAAGEDEAAAALSQAEARADVIIEARAGAVLGALTILKEDYFPGMKSARLPQALPGAGNFRRMAGPPVYGVAMCTAPGIANVLAAVAADVGDAGKRQPVLWFNMREEPVVYINGLPFVLREQQRPMKNLQEYAGIDAERIERMEARLKQDVLAEAAQHGGRILVARESAAPPGNPTAATADGITATGTGELIDMWEPISSPDAVQTPAEVYAGLAAEGLGVRYLRVPVTDGRAPQACDIDAIMRQVHSAGFDRPMVFNCQMGAGRTTTGTVIGGLLAMYGVADVAAAGNPGDAAAAAATTPVQQLLASAPSTTSMSLDDLPQGMEKDILREELAGDSPRHSEDDDRDSPAALTAADRANSKPLIPRASSVAELWGELSPEEVQERVALAGGGYMGVRRVVRLLAHGDNAKRVVDAAIDANAQMLNLRVAIMRFRRPKHQYQNHKSEVSARHSSFSRGSAYLERYCLLIAFGAYLDAEGLHSSNSFEQWLEERPELQQALSSIHTNPATALAPVPVTAAPVVYRAVRGSQEVTPTEQDEVLRKRRGKTLNRRIILKSYLARAADPSLPPGTPDVRQAAGLPVFAVGNVSVDAFTRLLKHLGAGPGGSTHVVITDAREELVVYVNGIPYIRRELEMPAAALHHAGVHARQLEALEAALKEDVAHEAAKWGGRILLHQEVFNAADPRRQSFTMGSSGGAAPAGNGLTITIPPSRGSSNPLPLTMVGSFLTPPVGPVPPTAVQLSAALASPAAAPAAAAAGTAGQVPPGAVRQRSSNSQLPPLSPMPPVGSAAAEPPGDGGFPGFKPLSPYPAGAAAMSPASAVSPAAAAAAAMGRAASCSSSQIIIGPEGAAAASNTAGDDVTAPVDVRPGAAVVPFWEPVDLSNCGDSSELAAAGAGSTVVPLATCLEAAKQLQAVGFHITYRRIPLSRERTPVPSDLSDMLKQMLALPAGVGPLDTATPGGGASPRAAAMMKEAADCVAAGVAGAWSGVAATTSAEQRQQQAAEAANGVQHHPRSIVHLVVSRTATGSSARFAAAAFATFLTKHSARESKAAAAAGGLNSPTAGTGPGSPGPAAKRMRRTHSDLGEYRGIMSVARLLPGGLEVKGAVDEAIDRCSAIGNLREDIKACKHGAEASPLQSNLDPGSSAWAARQLGVHYLKRYFLLIAFRCYLVQRQRSEQLGRPCVDFSRWVEDRRELGHLLNHLNLDT